MKFILYFYFILILNNSALAENSTFKTALNELRVTEKQNLKRNIITSTPLLKVNLKKDPPTPRSNKSTTFLLGLYNNQNSFSHPRFRQTIENNFFDKAPVFSVQPQMELMGLKILNQELTLGCGAHISYTQTKKRMSSANFYDDLRFSNFAYGLGPILKWHLHWASHEMEIQTTPLLMYNYESINSASQSLKHYRRLSSIAGFITLRYFLARTYYLDFQKTLNQDANLWNLGFGTLL